MSDVPPPHAPSGAPKTARPKTAGEGLGTAPKRPKSVVVALAFSFALAMGCWNEGCDRLAFYRGERDHRALLSAQIPEGEERARVVALYDRFTNVADDAHNRVVPMAAAIFVLGAALMTLSARALSGRRDTRNALVQILGVQAVVVAANYFVTRDVREADLTWQSEVLLVQQQMTVPPDQYVLTGDAMTRFRKFGPPTWLVLRTLVTGLVMVALTSQKSRAFFEAPTPSAD